MRILQINITYKLGSTGKIMADLDDVIRANGHEGFMLCGITKTKKNNLFVVPDIFEQPYANLKNIIRMRITGRNGHTHRWATKEAISWIDDISPDIVHIHNIHGNWIYLPLLFSYLREKRIPVILTLHDCWSFTGRCSHFELIGCDKWESECHNCRNRQVYPATYFFDFSRPLYIEKRSCLKL